MNGVSVVLERRPKSRWMATGAFSYVLRYVDRPPDVVRRALLSGSWEVILRPAFDMKELRPAARLCAGLAGVSPEEAFLRLAVGGCDPDFVFDYVLDDCGWKDDLDAVLGRDGEVLYRRPPPGEKRGDAAV